MHLSKEELQKMEQMDIRDAVPEELVDISGIEIDMKKPVPAQSGGVCAESRKPPSL